MTELTVSTVNDNMAKEIVPLAIWAAELGYKIYDLGDDNYTLSKGVIVEHFNSTDIEIFYNHLRFVAKFERHAEDSHDEDTEETPIRTPNDDRDAQLARLEERILRLEQRIGAKMDEAEMTDDYWYYLGKFEALIPEFRKHGAILSVDRAGGKAYYSRARKPTVYNINKRSLKNAQTALCVLRKRDQSQASETDDDSILPQAACLAREKGKRTEVLEEITKKLEAERSEIEARHRQEEATVTEWVSELMERADKIGASITWFSSSLIEYEYNPAYDQPHLLDILPPVDHVTTRAWYDVPEDLASLSEKLTEHEHAYYSYQAIRAQKE